MGERGRGAVGMTYSLTDLEIVDHSEAEASGCFKQLTKWVDKRSEIEFAIEQLDKYEASWALRQTPSGKVALFIPGKKDFDA